MRAPNIFWIGELQRISVQTKHPTVGWTPARPMGLYGLALHERIKAAWMVFTGKADVVKWYDTGE